MFSNVTVDNFIKYDGVSNKLADIVGNINCTIYPVVDEKNAILYGIVDDSFMMFGVHRETEFDNDGIFIDVNHPMPFLAFNNFFVNHFNTDDYIIGQRIDNLGVAMRFMCGVKYKQIPCFNVVMAGGKYCNQVFKA